MIRAVCQPEVGDLYIRCVERRAGSKVVRRRPDRDAVVGGRDDARTDHDGDEHKKKPAEQPRIEPGRLAEASCGRRDVGHDCHEGIFTTNGMREAKTDRTRPFG